MSTEREISHLRVAYSYLPPFVIAKNYKNGTSILKGFMPDILLALAKWMNITLTLVREPSDTFGTCINNTWNGMVGMLFRNEVDLILNPLIPKIKMMEFSHFTNPITIDAYTFLSGEKTQEAGLFLFFNVLSGTVWVTMFVSAVAIALTSTAIYKRIIMPEKFSAITMTRRYCWMLLAYTLRQNPSERYLLRKSRAPISMFLPLFTAIWIICIGFLVMHTFQCLLVSKLTVRKSEPLVDSLDDLLKSHAPPGLVSVEIQIEDILQDTKIPVYEAAWKKIKHNLFPGWKVFNHETILKVQDGQFCIVHGQIILQNRLKDFFKRTSYCKMHLSKNYFSPFPLVLAMHKSVPIKFYEKFNTGLTRMIDADIPGKTFRISEEFSNMCVNYNENHLNPLRIRNIYGALVVWMSGLLLGWIILFIEVTCKKLEDKHDKKH